MLKQLEKDAEVDEEVYEKFVCWCTVNDKEKTKAIKDAEAKIKLLGLQIGEWSARSSSLSVDISGHIKVEEDLRANLEKATAIRKKELAEFNAHEQDLLDMIAALKAAIEQLQPHHPHTAMMLLQRSGGQGASSAETQVAATLRRMVAKYSDLIR